MEAMLKNVIDQLNERLKTDEKLQETVRDKTRTVQIEVTDENTYSFLLDKTEVRDFKVAAVDNPDIRIITDKDTLTGILNREINPLKAYVTRKLQLKASLMDLLTIKSLLSG